MSQSDQWISVCAAADIDEEDVMRFDYGERSFAIYRSDEGGYFATDGFCTHGKVHLSGGLVIGKTIECPKHNGRFDYTTGHAKRVPACVNLNTYDLKIESGHLYIRI